MTEFTWEDFNGSRMAFASVEEMQSFLRWRSGRFTDELRVSELETAVGELSAALEWVGRTNPRVLREMPGDLFYPALAATRTVPFTGSGRVPGVVGDSPNAPSVTDQTRPDSSTGKEPDE